MLSVKLFLENTIEGVMMWFDIIKNQELTTTQLGGTMDWENEVIPDDRDEDCKMKLLSAVKYLKNVKLNNNPKNTVAEMSGGELYVYRSVVAPDNSLVSVVDIGLIGINKVSNDAICEFNEKIKEAIRGLKSGSFNNGYKLIEKEKLRLQYLVWIDTNYFDFEDNSSGIRISLVGDKFKLIFRIRIDTELKHYGDNENTEIMRNVLDTVMGML